MHACVATLTALAGETTGNMILGYISGEDLGKYLCVLNFGLCHDKLVNQQCAAHSGLPQDDESSH